jgi:hypothetical protein
MKAEARAAKQSPPVSEGTIPAAAPTRSPAASAARTPTAATGSLSAEDLAILKAPFPRDSLGVKVQSYSKDRTRVMLVLYLQHTDVQDRLEQVDPAWTSEVTSEERAGDTVYVRTRLTLKGVSRENVGEGGDPKAAYSDALKRAAMLFGVGRYLYDSETVWADYDDSRDRFKQWSIEDYESALRRKPGASRTASAPAPAQRETPPAPPPAAKETAPAPGLKTRKTAAAPAAGAANGSASASKEVSEQGRSRDQLNRILMNLYRPYLSKFPDTRFVELLYGRYNVGETRLMTVEQLEDLVEYMEAQLRTAA